MNSKRIVRIILLLILFSNLVIGQNVNVDSPLRVVDTTNYEEAAKTFIDIADSYYGVSVSNYLQYSLKAVHFAELSENESILNDALNQLAIAYHFSGKLDLAIVNYKKVLDFLYLRKDTTRITRTIQNIGISYDDLGMVEKALECYNQALYLATLSHDSLGMVNVLSSLAYFYSYTLNLKKSVEVSLRALEISEKNNYQEKISNILNSISVTFGRMEDYDKAMYYQRKALMYIDKNNGKSELASSYNNIGLIYKKMGMLDSAEYNYRIALKLKKEVGEVKNQLTAYDNIGSLYLMRNKYSEALQIYFEALKIADEGKFLDSQLMLIVDIGEVYYEMGNYKEADRYFQRGLKMGENGNSTENLIRLYQNLYNNSKAAGNMVSALQYGEKYHTLKDSIFDIENQKQLLDIETKYQTEKKENEILLLTKEKELKNVELQKQRELQYILAGAILLLIFMAILIFSRYRLKQQSIRHKLEKEKLDTEGKLLRSQMNPHFIFNSLNSIQSFISSNEPFKAMTYLSKFGKLTRDILEYSRESFITLDEEINCLELYLELETLRFKDNIRYSIVVDLNIDIETALIPPIIVQPFVENAIKHGLRQKQGDRLLEINFRFEDDKLLCTIWDNGIGRGASMKSKDKNHNSLGIQITTERLQNINRKAKSETNFVITDLYDNDGNASGTKVVITLPKMVT